VVLTDEARRFLEEKRFAVLATVNADGSAQQTVMWYMLRGDQVVMNTKRGRLKDRNLLRDRRVSICVEDGYRFVTIAGEVAMIEDQDRAQTDIKALATRYHGVDGAEQRARDQFLKEERISMLLPMDGALVYGFEDE